MRVCITCLNLINYSGSERVIYELCKEFEIKGIEVHIACVNVGEFYYKELSKFYITNNSDMLDDEYDLIINFHWPSFPYFFKDGIFVKKNIHFSLSPFEEIEFPLLSENLYDLILCNSIETSISIRNLFESSLIKKIELSVFPNSINIQDSKLYLREGISDSVNSLKKIIVVSNHLPNELREVEELFNNAGIKVFYIGIEHFKAMVNFKLLKQFDLVISIGYTVVMAMALKIPVYIYDHMGGPGWIRNDIKINHKYNFSGRPWCSKKTSNDIYIDIMECYSEQIKSLDEFYDYVINYHNISHYVDNLILNCYESKLMFRKPSNQLIKQSCSYIKLLSMNVALQDKLSSSH